MLEGDRQFNLTLRFAPKYRSSVEEIGNLKVGYQTASGSTAYITLKELANITLDTGQGHRTKSREFPMT